MANLGDYEPVYTYTDEPFEAADPYDGSMPLDVYRARLDKYNRIERARRNPMLNVRANGRALYALSESGNLRRTSKVSARVKREVAERDGECVWCGSEERYEIDHIVPYIDGGSNEASNLRRLCLRCHHSRGGERRGVVQGR